MTREEEALMNEQVIEEEQEIIQSHQQLKRPKLRWIPLESNPDVSFVTSLLYIY
jgi:hypothetical protein